MRSREQAVQILKSMPGAVPPGIDPEPMIAAIMAGQSFQPAVATTVTPASPAPVEAGAPVVAPPPTAPTFLNQSQLAANVTQPKMLSIEDIENRARAAAQQIAETRRAARLEPEMEEMFARQAASLEGAEEGIDRERGRQGWNALAMAGARMAQSQSPFFASALGEGLEAGLFGYNRARAQAAEQKARLGDRRGQIAEARYRALQDARNQAVTDMNAGMELTKNQTDLLNATNEEIRDAALQSSKVTEAEAKARYAAFEAENAPEKFALERRKTEAEINDRLANIAEGKARIDQGWARLKQEKAAGGNPAIISSAQRDIFSEYQKTARELMGLASDERERGMGDPAYEARARAYEAEARDAMAQARSVMPRGSGSNPYDLRTDAPKDIPYGSSMRLPDGSIAINTRGAGAAKPATSRSAPPPIGAPPPGAVRVKTN